MTPATKILLATLLAVGLMPLAAAHQCEEGVYSVDPRHGLTLICNLLVCIHVPHTCLGSVNGLLADPAGLPLLP